MSSSTGDIVHMKVNPIIAAGHIDPTRAFKDLANACKFRHYQSALLASYEGQEPYVFQWEGLCSAPDGLSKTVAYMEDGRHEEAVEGAGCDVRVARRGVPGIEVIADSCNGHFLHPGKAFVVLSDRSFDKSINVKYAWASTRAPVYSLVGESLF